MITSLKQRKLKFEPRTKLNHNIDILLCQLSSWHWNILHFFCLFSASLLVLKISGFLVCAQNREKKNLSMLIAMSSFLRSNNRTTWDLVSWSFTGMVVSCFIFHWLFQNDDSPSWPSPLAISFYCNRSKSRNKGRHNLICDFVSS